MFVCWHFLFISFKLIRIKVDSKVNVTAIQLGLAGVITYMVLILEERASIHNSNSSLTVLIKVNSVQEWKLIEFFFPGHLVMVSVITPVNTL